MKLTPLDKLRNQYAQIRDQIHEIEHKEFVKEKRDIVGKCFKFKNSYSCPETEADYWWAYKRITGLDKSANCFTSFSFEIDRDGNCSTNVRAFDMLSEWKPCTEEEYLQAWLEFKHTINNIKA